jgi:hypothetical protein
MSLPEFSIKRPVTVLMACVIALLLGGIAFVQIPVDLMPETEYPTITVAPCTRRGAGRDGNPRSAPARRSDGLGSGRRRAHLHLQRRPWPASASSFTYGMDLDEAANELRARSTATAAAP